MQNNQGKSFGGRIVYVEYISADKIYFLDVYLKKYKKDLTKEDKDKINTVIALLEDNENAGFSNNG